MSWRRLRGLLVLLVIAGAVIWYVREKPTMSELVDNLTRPLFGSRAAVKESERKRVMSDAVSAVTQQTDENVGMLRENMTSREVRDLLGEPDRVEDLPSPNRVRWTYRVVKRAVLFRDGRVVSISIL